MGNNKSRGKVQGKKSYVDKIKSREIEVTFEELPLTLPLKSINDVPNEVIQKNIMAYLSDDEIRSFGRTGTKRFKVIADDELDKRRK